MEPTEVDRQSYPYKLGLLESAITSALIHLTYVDPDIARQILTEALEAVK
jgi:hypothetical protein